MEEKQKAVTISPKTKEVVKKMKERLRENPAPDIVFWENLFKCEELDKLFADDEPHATT